jgi:hypothetical protein
MGQTNMAMSELDSYLKLMEAPEEAAKSGHFIEKLLDDRPGQVGLQQRMVNFYVSHDQTDKAVEKLDGLAEKLLKGEDKINALATVKRIIALNPPNASEYQKLYTELSLK